MKKQIQESLSTDMNSIIDARIKEIDDRKQRSHNLMLYNLPESNYDNPEQRKLSDIVLTCELAGHLGVKLNLIKGFRIGKRDTDRTWPYKLTIDSKKERRELLLRAKQIKIKAPEQLKKVVITTEMTPNSTTR